MQLLRAQFSGSMGKNIAKRSAIVYSLVPADIRRSKTTLAGQDHVVTGYIHRKGRFFFGAVVARHVGGWIKLHRRILAEHSWVGHDAYALALFVTILLEANTEDGESYVRQGVIIKRGQYVTSYEALAGQLNLSRSMVRRKLDRMTQDKMLAHQADRMGSIITVINYDKYQDYGAESGIDVGTGSAHQRPHMEEDGGLSTSVLSSASKLSGARARVDPVETARLEARAILARALGAPARAASEDEEEIWAEVGVKGRAVITTRYKGFREFWDAYFAARRRASQTVVDAQFREEFVALLMERA